jgi:hypothetical protein
MNNIIFKNINFPLIRYRLINTEVNKEITKFECQNNIKSFLHRPSLSCVQYHPPQFDRTLAKATISNANTVVIADALRCTNSSGTYGLALLIRLICAAEVCFMSRPAIGVAGPVAKHPPTVDLARVVTCTDL